MVVAVGPGRKKSKPVEVEVKKRTVAPPIRDLPRPTIKRSGLAHKTLLGK